MNHFPKSWHEFFASLSVGSIWQTLGFYGLCGMIVMIIWAQLGVKAKRHYKQ